ncbi:MAG TPA: carboxymuconolactone decarboxylase family protein [Holophaga sp.]|nr:carboxymuconolactone decarboxylase family protein [Holophaga sp.]
MSDAARIMNESVRELVAIGAAMVSNCEPCFRYHHDQARRLGVSREDMREAVDVALAVKATPHQHVVETADRYLARAAAAPEGREACACSGQGCC